jgi:hypothetical protein
MAPKNTANKFKSQAEKILRYEKSEPNNMEDFLKNTQSHKGTTTDLHNNTNAQMQNLTNEHLPKSTNHQMHMTSKVQSEELGRLHIQIKQDLIEKLLDTVFKRKRDRKVKNRKATQRAVIEEALEMYFTQDRVS